MRWTGDVARGAWIASRLTGWASRDAIVPNGFPAYVRIFHPGTRYWWEGPVNQMGSTRIKDRPVTWTEVADLTGKIAHPWMQWGTISGRHGDEVDLGDGTSLDGPEDGRLPRDILHRLLPLLTAATSTPADAIAAVWEGWGELHHIDRFGWPEQTGTTTSSTLSREDLGVDAAVIRALEQGPLLELPSRRYLLLEGALSDLAAGSWKAAAGLGRGMDDDGVAAPQLLWPEDHAWCLATEIDFGFSLLAGSTALIDEVLARDDIESGALDHDGDLSWDGDSRNPPALDR